MRRCTSTFACVLVCVPILGTSVLGAQAKPALAGQPASAVAPTDLTAALAFRSSLTAAAASDLSSRPRDGSAGFLQAIELRFLPYPGAAKYEILRAASQVGPWVFDHDTRSLVESLRGLPPSTPVFARVVAMRQGQREGTWLALDTTNSTVTQTANPISAGLGGGAPGQATYVVIRTCQVMAPATVRITWLRTYGATGYVVHPSFGHPATALPTIAVPDTEFVQDNVASGEYRYDVHARYDIANWPGPGQTLTLYQAGGAAASKAARVGGANPGC
jgi:hypothetical protein